MRCSAHGYGMSHHRHRAQRRRFLGASIAACAAPWVAAQPVNRRVVLVAPPGEQRLDSEARVTQLEYYAELFAQEGFVRGQGFTLERVAAESPLKTDVARLARQVIATGPALILVDGDSIREFMRHTSTIPLVFYALLSDPVRWGVVESLARPGANVTGTTLAAPFGDEPKGWEMLKALAPRAKRIGVTWYEDELSDPVFVSESVVLEAAGKRLGLAVVDVVVPRNVDAARFEAAVRSAKVDLLDAVGLGGEDSLSDIMRFVERARLPAVWHNPALVSAGGLLSATGSVAEAHREAVKMAALILRGARPAGIPVRSPRRHITAVNLKTARAMGIMVPQSVLIRADVVVE